MPVCWDVMIRYTHERQCEFKGMFCILLFSVKITFQLRINVAFGVNIG